jgi:hypothetical protein
MPQISQLIFSLHIISSLPTFLHPNLTCVPPTARFHRCRPVAPPPCQALARPRRAASSQHHRPLPPTAISGRRRCLWSPPRCYRAPPPYPRPTVGLHHPAGGAPATWSRHHLRRASRPPLALPSVRRWQQPPSNPEPLTPNLNPNPNLRRNWRRWRWGWLKLCVRRSSKSHNM